MKEWHLLVKDTSVTSAIPAYLKNTEAPIIYDKY